jgi:hypothetical protein
MSSAGISKCTTFCMINFLLGEIGTFNNLVTALGAVSTVVGQSCGPTLIKPSPDKAQP